MSPFHFPEQGDRILRKVELVHHTCAVPIASKTESILGKGLGSSLQNSLGTQLHIPDSKSGFDKIPKGWSLMGTLIPILMT